MIVLKQDVLLFLVPSKQPTEGLFSPSLKWEKKANITALVDMIIYRINAWPSLTWVAIALIRGSFNMSECKGMLPDWGGVGRWHTDEPTLPDTLQ